MVPHTYTIMLYYMYGFYDDDGRRVLWLTGTYSSLGHAPWQYKAPANTQQHVTLTAWAACLRGTPSMGCGMHLLHVL